MGDAQRDVLLYGGDTVENEFQGKSTLRQSIYFNIASLDYAYVSNLDSF